MRPSREQGQNRDTSYFVSTQTARRQPFFRHERWANLLSETIVHYDNIGYCLHAYVIMPDHVHLLVTPADSLEKAVQHFKGGFSFRARKEFAWKADIWQPGFTDHRIRDDEDWNRHIEYIRTNPIRARLAVGYPYVGFPSPNFPQGLKPRRLVEEQDVRAEARTLHAEARTLMLKPVPFMLKTVPFRLKAVPFEGKVLGLTQNSKGFIDDRFRQGSATSDAERGASF
ncbi:MAG TPA: transposase [Terracidiphilus sp.]